MVWLDSRPTRGTPSLSGAAVSTVCAAWSQTDHRTSAWQRSSPGTGRQEG